MWFEGRGMICVRGCDLGIIRCGLLYYFDLGCGLGLVLWFMYYESSLCLGCSLRSLV